MASLKRVAVVTGAAGGIGRAIALRLADDGIDIAVCDLPGSKTREVATEIEQKGQRALVVHADIENETEVTEMVDSVVSELGGLDIMIANAGILQTTGDISTTSLEDFHRIMRVNAGGVFLCYKYAAKQMMSQGRGGRIIGASSMAGMQALGGDGIAYSASKFAIRGLTQATAASLAKHGITVNAYAPGIIDTPMARQAAQGIPGAFEAMVSYIPVGRVGVPDDVANLVAYLASDKASFITGQTISMNGGALFT